MVQTPRTSSNLLNPHAPRARKVCTVLSLEFRVVRLYQTFSSYSVTGERRCAGCLSPSSGWFKHSEPLRTFSNQLITEIARCVEFCNMSSGWFQCTESSQHYYGSEVWEGNRTQVAALESVMLGGAKRILAGPVGLRLEKVRYSSTTPTSCERTLHILLFVQSCGSRSAANLLKPS